MFFLTAEGNERLVGCDKAHMLSDQKRKMAVMDIGVPRDLS